MQGTLAAHNQGWAGQTFQNLPTRLLIWPANPLYTRLWKIASYGAVNDPAYERDSPLRAEPGYHLCCLQTGSEYGLVHSRISVSLDRERSTRRAQGPPGRGLSEGELGWSPLGVMQ